MNPRVVAVCPGARHRLKITFSSGEVGVYDCRPLLDFGVFRELRDDAYFRRVRVEGGTVVWPHEQDICPDTLYEEAVFLKAASLNRNQSAGGGRQMRGRRRSQGRRASRAAVRR